MITHILKDQLTLELSLEEAPLLSNAVNEVCNGFKLLEFEKKIGTNTANASVLLKTLSQSCAEAIKVGQGNGEIYFQEGRD